LIRSQIVDPQFKDFSPRIGLAYRPFNNNKTAIRASYGIFYMDDWANAVSFTETNPPFEYQVSVTNVNPDATKWNGTPWQTYETMFPAYPNSGAGLAGMNPKDVDPRVQQWTLSLQRQVGNSVLLSLEYLGNHGTHNRFSWLPNSAGLPNATDLATLEANPSLDSTMADARRPLPNVNRGFIWEDNSSNAWYEGLNVKADGRFKRLYFSAAYTWSKAEDQTSQDNTFGDNSSAQNLNLSKSYAAFDHPQRFVSSAVYDLPIGEQFLVPHNAALKKLAAGWEVTGISTFEAGSPFSVLFGADTAFAGQAVYATRTGPAVYSDIRKSNGIYITPQNFSHPPFGSLSGQMPRNMFHGPGINNFDLGFIKNTAATEKLKVQFRAEMFNAFNHAQFAVGSQSVAYGLLAPAAGQTLPQIQYTAPSSFGRASARDARIIQFGLKLLF